MTVETLYNTTTLQGNGSADVFDFSFKVLDEAHLSVTRRLRSSGAIVHTYEAGEYIVDGIGEDAGTITLIEGPLDADYDIIITRTVPYTQELDIVNQGGFYPNTLEDQLDKMQMQIQQVANDAGDGEGYSSIFGATRTTAVVLDDMPWLNSFNGATDQAKLENFAASGISRLMLPGRRIYQTAKISPIAPFTMFGQGNQATVFVTAVNDYMYETLAWNAVGPIAMSFYDIGVEGDLDNANAGFVNAYDNGNALYKSLRLIQLRGTNIRYKYGVGIIAHDIRIAGVNGGTEPVVLVTGDGSAVVNGAYFNGLYITGGPTAFRAYRASDIVLDVFKAESYDDWGFDGESGSGFLRNAYFECPGANPGRTLDFSLDRASVRATEGDWDVTWSGVDGDQRMHELSLGNAALGFVYRSTNFAGFVATDTWYEVAMEAAGLSYYCDLNNNRLRFQRSGVFEVTIKVNAAEVGGSSQIAGLRALYFAGGVGGGTVITGSDANGRVISSSANTLIATFPVSVLANDEIGIEGTGSSSNVQFLQVDGGGGTIGAPTVKITASIFARALGLTQ